LAGDESLIGAFLSGRDIHSETAKIIFGSFEKEFRERAKAINYGIIYGISAFGLAKQLSVGRKEASEFMEAYFKTFPRLKDFMNELIERTRKRGYSETLFGRRRPLPDIHSSNPALKQMAERMAINAPVQGTAADIMKSAMVRVCQQLRQKGFKSRLLLQVHDELVLEVLKSELEEVRVLVSREMENLSETPIKKLKVPLVVDTSFGPSWAELS
jgi:DNA polymerase-1